MQLSETSLSHASPQPPASLGAWDYWDVNLSLSFPSWAPNVSIWVHCCCSLHIVLTLVTRVSRTQHCRGSQNLGGGGDTKQWGGGETNNKPLRSADCWQLSRGWMMSTNIRVLSSKQSHSHINTLRWFWIKSDYFCLLIFCDGQTLDHPRRQTGHLNIFIFTNRNILLPHSTIYFMCASSSEQGSGWVLHNTPCQASAVNDPLEDNLQIFS